MTQPTEAQRPGVDGSVQHTPSHKKASANVKPDLLDDESPKYVILSRRLRWTLLDAFFGTTAWRRVAEKTSPQSPASPTAPDAPTGQPSPTTAPVAEDQAQA